MALRSHDGRVGSAGLLPLWFHLPRCSCGSCGAVLLGGGDPTGGVAQKRALTSSAEKVSTMMSAVGYAAHERMYPSARSSSLRKNCSELSTCRLGSVTVVLVCVCVVCVRQVN